MTDISVRADENWRITVACHYADGTTLPLTSGTEFEFRIVDDEGEVVTYSIGEGVLVTDELGGIAEVSITAADQATYSLTPSNNYWYEARATVGDTLYFQVTGRLKIIASLFAASVDPLLLEFRMRFEEFSAIDDQIVKLYLADATRIIDGDDLIAAADRSAAIVYLAAHFISQRKSAYTQSTAGGGATTGLVQSVRIEDRAVTYATGGGVASKAGMDQTIYGQQYLSMIRRGTRWLLRG